MPIYEFYCPDCNSLLKFLARKVDTAARPACPRCAGGRLSRQVSMFAAPGSAREEPADAGAAELPGDERRMEQAMQALSGEMERIDENNPRQAAALMRKFSSLAGMPLNETMQAALGRMEAGEDPEQVEADMGSDLESSDPFAHMEQRVKNPAARGARRPPIRDETLYDM